jgi:small multidrug resistance pump
VLPYYAALLAAILLGVAGQLLFKSGAVRTSEPLRQLLDARTLLGFALYALSAILYVLSLRRIPLSTAFPSVSLSYVAVAAAGHLLWHEPLGGLRIGGLILVLVGVTLLNYRPH